MTQEEKYKEALLEARAVLEPCLKYSNGKVREALDSIDNELKRFDSEDEDERIRKWLVDYFKAVGKSWIHRDISPEQILAYLEKQKEEKPEWSEEDEKMRDRLITRLNWITYNTRTDGTSPNITFFDEIAWLKSLRPQYHGDVTMTEAYKMGLEAGKASSWKPSEEQIYSLGTVVKGSGYCAVGSVGYNLKSLYENLKKL